MGKGCKIVLKNSTIRRVEKNQNMMGGGGGGVLPIDGGYRCAMGWSWEIKSVVRNGTQPGQKLFFQILYTISRCTAIYISSKIIYKLFLWVRLFSEIFFLGQLSTC